MLAANVNGKTAQSQLYECVAQTFQAFEFTIIETQGEEHRRVPALVAGALGLVVTNQDLKRELKSVADVGTMSVLVPVVCRIPEAVFTRENVASILKLVWVSRACEESNVPSALGWAPRVINPVNTRVVV